MNVTKNEIKDRQLHIEDYLQRVSAQQKEYAEVFTNLRITESNDISTDFQADKLMEKILQSDNLNKAYKKVKSNNGMLLSMKFPKNGEENPPLNTQLNIKVLIRIMSFFSLFHYVIFTFNRY